jgi:hypothetical protein
MSVTGSWPPEVASDDAAMPAALPNPAAATTYEVGPAKADANVGDVPLESLTADDTVLIYFRPPHTGRSS